MKSIIPIILFAITAVAGTPITENHFRLLVKKYDNQGNPTTVADYRMMVDYMNSRFNTCFTNQDGTVSTNYFMAIAPTEGYNAHVNLASTTNLITHNCISNTVTHDVCYVYTWWGGQSGFLTKEIMNDVKQLFSPKIFDIDYFNEDCQEHDRQTHWVAVTNGVTP